MEPAHVTSQKVVQESASLNRIQREWSNGSNTVHYAYRDEGQNFLQVRGGAFNPNTIPGALIGLGILAVVYVAVVGGYVIDYVKGNISKQ